MKIKLSKGQETEVDPKDFEYLSQWKWSCSSGGYAVREQHLGMSDGKKVRETILMHRVITDAPRGMDVDHANNDKLDNRRSNLRVCTRSQNMANKGIIRRMNGELPKGVTYNPSLRTKQPYMSRVTCRGKSYFLGNFYTPQDAHKAYLVKKKELFGEFA